MTNTTWLAGKFTVTREVIEAAETPFAKLAIFVLPVLAPLVPASITGLHLYMLFIKTLKLGDWTETVSFMMAFTVALVLELLGYVGAVTAIKSLFSWIEEKNTAHFVPFGLNSSAYIFYLIAMISINYFLGKYLGEDALVVWIFSFLSFFTVPTSLLAGNHLREVAEEERSEKSKTESQNREDMLRREQQLREDEKLREKEARKLERFRIKHGNFPEPARNFPAEVESFQKVSNVGGKISETFQKDFSSGDWRKVRSQLSTKEMETLANLPPDKMEVWAKASGRTYRTIQNWKDNARKELGIN